MKKHLSILAAVVVALAVSSKAQAQMCGGGGYGCGYGCDLGLLYNSLDYNVPYFAAHPPVYYSYPVPRTYGYSPFAYPPGVMTPDVVNDSAPIEITNPYVPSSQQDKSKDHPNQTAASVRRQPEPLVIDNPYVSTKESIARVGN